MFTKASFTKVDWLNLCRLTGVGPGVSSLHECVEAQVLVCSCMTRLSPHQPCYQSMRCSSSLLLPLSCGLQFGGYSGITLNAFGEMSKDFMVDPNFNVQTGCQEISGGNRLSRKEQPLYTKKITPIDTENEFQRKKEIRWEKNQLDEDEANVDEEIAWLEEEFRLAAKEEEEEEEEEEEGFDYAWLWYDQDGDDSGILREYAPCKYFFKSKHGCQKNKTCQFSHDKEIFGIEPFTAFLKNLAWDRKERKTFPRPPPYPPPGGPPKKHRRVKRDEEDLP